MYIARDLVVMEVKDIIKEDKNKIVPSYEHNDYYREDGSRLYNSNREANWYKIGVLDCFEYFENNRLRACDTQTPEEAERESAFVMPFIKEHHRTPTFSDAIESTRKQMIEKMELIINNVLGGYIIREFHSGNLYSMDRLVKDIRKAMEEYT